jgi:hypothetical protein
MTPATSLRAGARFIHAHYLKREAMPPYGEDSYQERVVTIIRNGTVYHTDAASYDAGDHRADRSFPVSKADEHVRRWIEREGSK